MNIVSNRKIMSSVAQIYLFCGFVKFMLKYIFFKVLVVYIIT